MRVLEYLSIFVFFVVYGLDCLALIASSFTYLTPYHTLMQDKQNILFTYYLFIKTNEIIYGSSFVLL